ncbi:MAG: nuclear transport factor 2 family protein [Acidobacteriota bacterium]|nr:nuclear transport factor 2 family protein [Acidobacteriota bacterium]
MTFVFAALLLAQSSSPVPPPADVRTQIVSAYRHSLDALARGDADAAMSIDTPDWVTITAGQPTRTKAEMAPLIRRDIQSMRPPAEWTAFWQPDYARNGTGTGIQVYSIEVQGDTAIVLSLVGNTTDRIVKGEPHRLWTGSHVRDTWVYTPAGWMRRKHEKLTTNEHLVDGRP